MALTTLTGKMQLVFQWAAQKARTGGNYSPISNPGTLTKSQNYGTAAANAAAGGADEIVSYQQAITAGSSATIDLRALTDVIDAAIVPARVKGWMIRLLSGADDSTLSPVPNANSTITISNDVTVPHPLGFRSGGSGLTVDITETGGVIDGVTIGTAGSGYPKSTSFTVILQQASGAGGVISVTTNGSGVPTAVAIVAAGTGYTAASDVPTVVQGFFTLTTGNAQAYVDVTAAGLTITATQKNIKIANNDGTNAVTAEIDLFMGTT